jgi:hypothetical protein
MLQYKRKCQCLLKTPVSILLVRHPDMGFLDLVVVPLLIFWGTCVLISDSGCSSLYSYWGLDFSSSVTSLLCFCYFNVSCEEMSNASNVLLVMLSTGQYIYCWHMSHMFVLLPVFLVSYSKSQLQCHGDFVLCFLLGVLWFQVLSSSLQSIFSWFLYKA